MSICLPKPKKKKLKILKLRSFQDRKMDYVSLKQKFKGHYKKSLHPLMARYAGL